MEAVRNRLRDITLLLPIEPINVSTGVVSSYVLISPPSGTTLTEDQVNNNIFAWNNYQTQKQQRLAAMKANYNEAYNYMTNNNNLTEREKIVFKDVQQKLKNANNFIESQYNYYKQNYYFTAKNEEDLTNRCVFCHKPLTWFNDLNRCFDCSATPI